MLILCACAEMLYVRLWFVENENQAAKYRINKIGVAVKWAPNRQNEAKNCDEKQKKCSYVIINILPKK